MKKFLLTTTAIAISICLFGCDTYVFGVKKDIWESLSEDQKKQVIIDYNKNKAEKQKQDAVLREKELENEAKIAPYKAIAQAIELSNNKNSQKQQSQQILTSIDTTFNKIKTTGNNKYSVSFSDSKKIKNWKVGDHILAEKNSSYDFYKINIVNLDRKESIDANKENS
tara:strand:- start:1536 stop:2039 length:504 start_codon:yes stop_codon:yes gene_type:complete